MCTRAHTHRHTHTTQRCDGDRMSTDDSGITGKGSELQAKTQEGQVLIRQRWRAKSKLTTWVPAIISLVALKEKKPPTCLESHHTHSNVLVFKPFGLIGHVRTNEPTLLLKGHICVVQWSQHGESKLVSPST